MSTITKYNNRTLDQEPDTAVILPGHDEYIVIGTYHLNKTDRDTIGGDRDQSSQPLRGGSIQILSYVKPAEEQQTQSPIACRDFSHAIVDLHFHPEDGTLLGAATSTGTLQLFRILAKHERESEETAFTIADVGSIPLSETEDGGDPPLITFFSWLPKLSMDGNGTVVTLVACDTNGDTKIVRAQIPIVEAPPTSERTTSPESFYQIETIHKQQYNLEAWVVSHITIRSPDSESTSTLVLSGGDDSHIVGSTCLYEENHLLQWTFKSASNFRVKDRHGAGVTAILPLGGFKEGVVPVLTGSYDDHIRLFILRPSVIHRGLELVTEMNLGGGVWRIITLDQYVLPDGSKHWTLLVCTMYDGAKIIRLTASPIDGDQAKQSGICEGYAWAFTVEAKFHDGHESMVYAAVAKRDLCDDSWHILTTSFYDRKLCEWQWKDTMKVITETI